MRRQGSQQAVKRSWQWSWTSADTAHVLWSNEAVRAASAQSKSWDNAMKSKAKLKALDDAVAAWRMLYAPSEGALGDGGGEGEGSDAEVSDNAANAGYDE